jgi:3-oxoacyl-[acyl-carrier protein] reductase
VIGLTRSLAREVGRFGITVNAVSPGLILTEMSSQLSEERRGELLKRVPLQRVGTAEEIAGMVWMLCHENAAYITGQCLSIDGGLT